MTPFVKLAHIADELDQLGLHEEADEVSQVLLKIAQNNQINQNAKQMFMQNYNQFAAFIKTHNNGDNNIINDAPLENIYNNLVNLSSQYLQNDPEIFKLMKWVVPTYQGISSNNVV